MEQIERAHDKALEMDLAEELTEARRELFSENWSIVPNPYSQIAVAEKIGVCDVSLCQWEKGSCVPRSFAHWQRWARALHKKLNIELEK